MNKLVADLIVLNQKVFNLHWNVRGEGFMSMHKMTEKLYEELTDLFDAVAEKIAMGGEFPISTLKECLEITEISEVKEKAFTVQEVVKTIVSDLEIIKKTTLEVKATVENQPLLDEIIQTIELQKWLFKSSL